MASQKKVTGKLEKLEGAKFEKMSPSALQTVVGGASCSQWTMRTNSCDGVLR